VAGVAELEVRARSASKGSTRALGCAARGRHKRQLRETLPSRLHSKVITNAQLDMAHSADAAHRRAERRQMLASTPHERGRNGKAPRQSAVR